MYFGEEVWLVSVGPIKQRMNVMNGGSAIYRHIGIEFDPLEIEVFERLDSPHVRDSHLLNQPPMVLGPSAREYKKDVRFTVQRNLRNIT